MRWLRCRLGLHAWEPVIRSPDGVVERQNCRRTGCGVGRVLYEGVEMDRGTEWWYEAGLFEQIIERVEGPR